MPSAKLVGKERHSLVAGVSMYNICIYRLHQCSFPSNSVSASAKGSVVLSARVSARKDVQLYVVVAS